jgi:DNA-binding transcriptional MerR regulator
VQSPPPTFTAVQICTALEISRGMLNNWLNDGYFKQFVDPNARPGRARKFSIDDLYRLAIFRLLLDHGVPVRQAEGWANLTVHHMNGPSQSRPTRVRIVRGVDVLLFDDMTPPQGHEPAAEIVIHLHALTNQLRQRLGLEPHLTAALGAPQRAPEQSGPIFPLRRKSTTY